MFCSIICLCNFGPTKCVRFYKVSSCLKIVLQGIEEYMKIKKQFNLTLEKFISNSNCVIKVAGHILYFISRPFNKEKLE